MSKPAVSQDMIQRIATLASLELTPAERESFAREIGDILFYFDRLKSVDVTGVEPMFQPLENNGTAHSNPLRANPLREDVIVPRLKTPMIDCAPQSLDGGFKVPQVL